MAARYFGHEGGRARAAARSVYDPLDPAKQHDAATAADVVAAYVDKRVARGASDVNKALHAWRKVCGRRAAKHTVAVWLNKPKSGVGLPELVVYLDGNALMVDLTTNAELFVDRLSYEGLEVARVRFKLSRKAGEHAVAQEEPSHVEEELPPLSTIEAARIADKVSRLDPRLRENASKAMEYSIRRAKLESTREIKRDPQNP